MIKNLKTLSWKKLDWKKAECDLAQLQNDICIAYKTGDLDKMKVLQHRLVNSYAARAVSVRQEVSRTNSSFGEDAFGHDVCLIRHGYLAGFLLGDEINIYDALMTM
jgi:hypothetical protein